MNARVAFIVLFAGAVSGAASSQPAERPSDRFLSPSGSSIEELVQAALEDEPGLQAAAREIDAAMAREQQEGLSPNPTLTVGWNEEIGGTDNNRLIGFGWPLDLWRKSARVTAAGRGTEAARAGVLDRERLLAAEVRGAAGNLLAAVRSLRVAEDLLEASRRFADLVDARVREGATPPLEGGILRVEVSRIDSERALGEARAEIGALEVRRLLGLMPDAPLTLRENLDEAARGFGPGSKEPAMEPRPDVRAADARVAAAGARQELAKRNGRADASLFASYSRMDSGFPQLGFGVAGDLERVRAIFHRVELGMSWELPLRNRNQGEVAAMQAEWMAAERDGARVRIAAAAELASAEVREAKALEAVEIYTRGVLQQARENLVVLRESYELGRSALLDVIAEERRYLEVERGYTETLLELYQARVDLRRARG